MICLGDYHEETGWQQYTEIDNKYIIKEFYELKKPVVLNYFEQKNYTDYAAYLTLTGIPLDSRNGGKILIPAQPHVPRTK